MTFITVEHDLDKITDLMDDMQRRQVPFATAKALTRTIKLAEAEVYREFERKFDRPTRTVMRGLFVKPATKQDLTAMVYVKDRPLGGKNPASLAEILRHQFQGGARYPKQLERFLRTGRYITAGEFVVPGSAAKMDAFGNMSRGQIQQIISQIGARRAGSDSAKTGSARSKRKRDRAGEIFWSYGPGSFGARAFSGRTKVDFSTGEYKGPRQNLPKGAWLRVRFGFGSAVKPLLLVVGQPSYKQRIDMGRIAQDIKARHFAREFDQAFREAKATAR